MNVDASHNYLISSPDQVKGTLVLAHGSGAGMNVFFMDAISEGLTNEDWRVVRFEFPYMVRQSFTGRRSLPDKIDILLETYRSVVETVKKHYPQPLFVGGKSMGGRIASLLADMLYEEGLIEGLICLGYPFHPLKNPDRLRTEHLRSLQVPTLIVQGERDPMGSLEEVKGYDLSDQIQIRWIPDGDHSFSPRKRSGFTEDQNLHQIVRCVDTFMNEVCGR